MESVQILWENFGNVCRACLKSNGHLSSLYGASMDQMLMAITNIEVGKDDQLPDKLCKPCTLLISRFYSFKMQYEKSQDMLLKVFKDHLKQEQKEIYHENKTELPTKLKNCNNDPVKRFQENLFLTSTEDEIDISSELTLDQSGGLVHHEDILPELVNTYEISQEYFKEGLRDDSRSKSELQVGAAPPRDHFDCDLCAEKYSSKSDLKAHRAGHATVSCGTCGKRMSPAALRRHSKTHLAVKPHACRLCERRFADSGNLRRHASTHGGQARRDKYLCSECGKSFKWATSLGKHLRYHTGVNLHRCAHCPRAYAERGALDIHMRAHTGERPHVCGACGRGFTQRANLERHRRVHAGARPHACPVCFKTFAQKGYIRVHMRVHTRERPHRCTVCTKAFSGPSSLKVHLKSHAKPPPPPPSVLLPLPSAPLPSLQIPPPLPPLLVPQSQQLEALSVNTNIRVQDVAVVPVYETLTVVPQTLARQPSVAPIKHMMGRGERCGVCGRRCATPLELLAHYRAAHRATPVALVIADAPSAGPVSVVRPDRVD